MMVTKLTHNRGDTWQRAWIITSKATGLPVDLTGATMRLHLRDKDGALVAAASLTDGRLTVDLVTGRVDMIMPASTMNLAIGRYMFDFEITYPTGIVKTYEKGQVLITQDNAYDS